MSLVSLEAILDSRWNFPTAKENVASKIISYFLREQILKVLIISKYSHYEDQNRGSLKALKK